MTDDRLALLEALLAEEDLGTPGPAGGIPPRAAGSVPPLAFGEEQLWLLQRRHPASVAYNVPVTLSIDGPVRASELARALSAVAARHEALRTRYPDLAHRPGKEILPPRPVPLPVVDLSRLGDAAGPAAGGLGAADARRPFDLGAGPPWRVALIRLGAHRHRLLWTAHHLITDGRSLEILGEDLAAALAGPVETPPALAFGDFAAWQRDRAERGELAPLLAAERERLDGAPALLRLPTDRPRRAGGGNAGGETSVRLDRSLVDSLRELARQRGTTLFTVLLAGFRALLARWTGEDRPPVGIPLANRDRAGSEGIFGFLVHVTPVACDVDPRLSFEALLERTAGELDRVRDAAELPFELLLEELAPERALSHDPLFQVSFLLRETPLPVFESPRARWRTSERETGESKLDLALEVVAEEADLRARVRYRRRLFHDTTVRRFVASFERLLTAVARRPGGSVGDASILSPAEEHLLRHEVSWSPDGGLSEPVPVSLEIAAWAARDPDRIALVTPAGTWSYGAIDRAARSLAPRLRAAGAGPEQRVGLVLPRSAEAIWTALAALYVGAAYVPFDPGDPPERLRDGLAAAGLSAVVSLPGAALPATGVARLDPRARGPVREGSGDDLPVSPRANSLAYVIFTSGSTGRPKAVGVSHRGLDHLAAWQHGRSHTGPGYRSGQLADLTFDASVWEVWVGGLSAGGTLVLVPEARKPDPEALLGFAAAERIDRLFVPSPVAEAFLDLPLPAHLALRTLDTGADTLHRRPPADWPIAMYNNYGPTEVTVVATGGRVAPAEADAPAGGGLLPPIGRPVGGKTIEVLDRRLRPVPLGVAGELLVGGDGVARGYLGRPGRTAESFVPDPASREPGARLYRTGDEVRVLPGGELDFLGRIDQQVQIRGRRIEPGEVAAALAALDAVDECAVVVVGDGEDARLVACVAPPPGVDEARLRALLAERLPAFMVPSSFLFLPALPLGRTGKLDRRALRTLAEAPAVAGRRAPQGPVEELLAGFWSELLEGREIGRDDDFFALGGHSLKVALLAGRLRSLGAPVPLGELFDHPTLAGQALRVERALGHRRGGEERGPEAGPAAGDHPLSYGQERLWLLDRLEPGSTAYLLPAIVRFRGPLDRSALCAALARVVARHGALRARFAATPDGPRQWIEDRRPRVAGVDLAALAGRDREAAEAEAGRLAADLAGRPFDLERDLLVRAALVSLGPEDHRLLLVLHHIVFDGWSLHRLLAELAADLAGAPVPDPPVAYTDFARWQRRAPSRERTEQLLRYWRERLGNPPPPLELPRDRPRPAVQSFRGGRVTQVLTPGETDALTALGRERGATLFMVLLAAFDVLLSRLSGQHDVVVGTPVTARPRPELEGLIGFFVDTLVLRTDLAGEPTFDRLLARVRETAIGAFAHQDLPFERLLEELQPERDLARTPLFQVFLNLASLPDELPAPPGVAVELEAPADAASKFDLTLYARTSRDGLRLSLVYNADLFRAARAEEMLRQLRRLLAAVAERPDLPVTAHSLVTPEAARRLPDPSAALPRLEPGSIPGRLAAIAGRTPEAIAVAAPGRAVSYGALAAYTFRLARRLRAGGLRRGDVVAIEAAREPELVPAILAALAAGGAFLLLDASHPAPRRAEMVSIAGPRAFLRLPGAPPGGPGPEGIGDRVEPGLRLDLPRLGPAPAEPLGSGPPAPPIETGPDDLACVTFTSGSTGRPLAVAGRHGALSAFMPGVARTFGLGAGDRFGMVSALTHDPLQRDVLQPLWSGATVVVPEDRLLDPGYLAAWSARERLTVLHLTPASLEILASGAEAPLTDLGHALVVGEALRRSAAARFAAAAPRAHCVNLYGTTETQRALSAWPVPPLEGDEAPGRAPEVLPLGRGGEGVQLLVLRRDGAPAGVGEVGEIHLRSHWLARGYLGDPVRTAERFLPHGGAPEGAATDRRYATGDRGRYRPDGTVEFAGRTDDQVQLRGFRVEIAEIEAVLGAVAGVGEAAVTARGDGDGGTRLVAYVAPEGAPGADTLRRELAARLPRYMVPGAFVSLAALPRTRTGKLDRRALPEPPPEAADGGGAPGTPLEELVASRWAEVLERPVAGPDADFFALGGHSLAAVRVLTRLREETGAELPLRALFEERTVAGLARRLEAALSAGIAPPPALEPLPPGATAPLSFPQRRLWFLEHMATGGTVYNLPLGLRLSGPLDAPALAGALGDALARHEALRTIFREIGGEPRQVVLPDAPEALPMIDLSGLADGEAQARRLGREAACLRLFEAADRRPLHAFRLLRVRPHDHRLVMVIHHLVFDGWSNGVLVNDLARFYRRRLGERVPPPAELPVGYGAWATWQRRSLEGDRLGDLLAYWRPRLAGVPPLDLATDRARPPVQTYRGATVRFPFGPETAASVSAAARRTGSTPFVVTLSAFQALLGRLSGQTDFAVGTPVAGRRDSRLEGVVGFFADTLVLRADLDGRPGFDRLVRRSRDAFLEALAHQDLPFEKLVEELRPARDLARPPLFQVLFLFQNAPGGEPGFPGLEVRREKVADDAARFELGLTVAPRPGGTGELEGALSYNSDLFDAVTARRLTGSLSTLLDAALADPEAPWDALPVLTTRERAALTHEARGTAAAPLPLVATLAAHAAAAPDRAAVLFGDRTLTLGELDTRTARLAAALRARGAGPEERVAVAVGRSEAMPVALLGVLRSGAAYVPLDPDHPPARLAMILEDSGARWLLTERRSAGAATAGAGAGLEVLHLDDLLAHTDAAAAPRGQPDPDAAAYVIYTSGSTGRPKGVVVSHGALASFLGAMAERPGLGPGDTLTAVTTPAFDIAALELYLPLLTGARLVVAGRSETLDGELLGSLGARQRTTTLQATPVTWRMLLAAERAPSPPRALVGGEALPPDLAAALLDTGAELWNLYGPTETTVWSATARVRDAGGIVLGDPAAGTRLAVTDPAGRLVPVGIPGELRIAGAGLARGYLGRPGLTAERFVPDPEGPAGARAYRTGDRVRRRSDGELTFLGRLDHQVKVRGFRIELGEVEGALASCPGIRAAAAAVRPGPGGEPVLTGYLVPEDEPPDPAALRARLRDRLPEAMVPNAWVVLPSLPTNPNGKLDRRALPDPSGGVATLRRPFVAPRNEVEREIAEVWRRVLGIDRVGIDDNFFDLGGHSLLLLDVQSRIRARLDREVSLVELFRYPNVASLAASLAGPEAEDRRVTGGAARAQKQLAARERARRARRRTPS